MNRFLALLVIFVIFVVVPGYSVQHENGQKSSAVVADGKRGSSGKSNSKQTVTAKTAKGKTDRKHNAEADGNPRKKKAQSDANQKKRDSKKQTQQKKQTRQTHSNSSIRSLQGQRAAIQRRIKQKERELKENEQKVREKMQNLLVINSEISTSQKKIDGIQKDLKHIDGNIDMLQEQLRTLEAQLQDRKRKYIKSMRYMARHRTVQDKLMFIFSASSFAQMYRRLRFVRQYAAYQKAQGETVKAKQNQVLSKHKELQRVRNTKNNLLSKGQQEKVGLESKQAEQQEVVKSLQQQQGTIQNIIAQQRKKDAALNAEIDRMVAREVAKTRARAEAEARKKAAAADAARKREAELAAKKKAAAEAAAENERRIAAARQREQQMKAAAEAAAEKARQEAEQARQAAAQKQKEEADRQAREAALAAKKKAEAEQAAKAAKAEREAVERKAKVEAERNKRAIETAKKQAHDEATLSAGDRMMSKGFENNKGRLPMPITGSYKVVTHFGQYNVKGLNGVTLDNKGINILGTSGCRARSIYDGVVSAVFGFGGTMVVMVRHGAFISVYCNLASVMVEQGERVATRQALGVVGPGNILQFQLRKETAKLNPESWLAR